MFNFGIVNVLSSGPGCPPHTVEFADGSYAEQLGAKWRQQRRGQLPVDIAWIDDNDGCGPRKLQNSIRCF